MLGFFFKNNKSNLISKLLKKIILTKYHGDKLNFYFAYSYGLTVNDLKIWCYKDKISINKFMGTTYLIH